MLFELLRKPGPKDMKASVDAFAYFEYGMTYMGWLPPTKGRKYYMIFRGLIIIWAVAYLPFGLLIGCFKDIKNYSPGDFLTSLQAATNDIGCSLRILVFYLYLSKYDKAKKLLNRLDEYCVDGADRCRIRYWVVRCNVVYIIYQLVYCNYLTMTFLSGVINGVAPWRVYNPVIDWQSSTLNLWIASTWELIMLSFAVLQEMLIDVFTVLYCVMLRVHIEILRQRVGRLRTDSEETEQKSYDDLVKCVEHHQLIMEYANLIRPLVSLTTFIQFLLTGTCLGFTMVNLFFFADFWSGLACIMYTAGLMCQTFPFCYVCDLIMVDCDNLALAIFHSNWIGSSRRYKSTLIQFIHRAQQSIAYSACSVFPICMQTNIKMAKLAFSVVAFVKQLNIADKLTRN